MAERPTRLVAHTPPAGSDEWHYLDDHLLEVAEMAAEFAAPFGGQDLAWWAGIYHDLGKAHPDFQEYLWKCFLEPGRKHPTVDHKTAGAVRSMEMGGEPLAHVLHAHHGGLSDLDVLKGMVRAYQERERERLDVSLERFRTLRLPTEDALVKHSPAPPRWLTGDALEMDVLIRMLFSAMVDADGLDTEAHWNRSHSATREEPFPSLSTLLERFDANQRAFSAQVTASNAAESAVNQVRREIYQACVDAAALPPGFFRMTAPTGGGKTRSGLAFALRHALNHGLRRVIVAVPFITITEQTADVYKRAVGNDAVLEHHSGLEPSALPRDREADGEENLEEMRQQLAIQNWDAPLIVTTTVQLFESIFTNRVSKGRKMHNLAASVLVLDEIQTLPAHMRGPILDMLRELVTHYRVSVVLSTATQPVLDTIAKDLDTGGQQIVELAPDPPRLFSILKRVNYELPFLDAPWSWERVAEEMRAEPQALAIVNTIKDAAALFSALGDPAAVHLSSRMCGAHRRDALADIRTRLRERVPCLVVSTQLVEAGVDLDFPLVLRAMGPLDRIVQAAGRCNREGKLDGLGRVVVFDAEEGGMPRGIYRQGADEARIMLQEPGRDLHDPNTFIDYFSRLYGLTDADRKGIQKMRANRNFASVANEFRIIEDDTIPVLVRYPQEVDDAGQIVAWNDVYDSIALHQRGVNVPLRKLMRDAQPWLVSCRYHEKERLLDQGMIVELASDIVWEWRGGYDPNLGITDQRLDPEILYIS